MVNQKSNTGQKKNDSQKKVEVKKEETVLNQEVFEISEEDKAVFEKNGWILNNDLIKVYNTLKDIPNLNVIEQMREINNKLATGIRSEALSLASEEVYKALDSSLAEISERISKETVCKITKKDILKRIIFDNNELFCELFSDMYMTTENLRHFLQVQKTYNETDLNKIVSELFTVKKQKRVSSKNQATYFLFDINNEIFEKSEKLFDEVSNFVTETPKFLSEKNLVLIPYRAFNVNDEVLKEVGLSVNDEEVQALKDVFFSNSLAILKIKDELNTMTEASLKSNLKTFEVKNGKQGTAKYRFIENDEVFNVDIYSMQIEETE